MKRIAFSVVMVVFLLAFAAPLFAVECRNQLTSMIEQLIQWLRQRLSMCDYIAIPGV